MVCTLLGDKVCAGMDGGKLGRRVPEIGPKVRVTDVGKIVGKEVDSKRGGSESPGAAGSKLGVGEMEEGNLEVGGNVRVVDGGGIIGNEVCGESDIPGAGFVGPGVGGTEIEGIVRIGDMGGTMPMRVVMSELESLPLKVDAIGGHRDRTEENISTSSHIKRVGNLKENGWTSIPHAETASPNSTPSRSRKCKPTELPLSIATTSQNG